MKYCTRCGAEHVDEAVVCPKCGCAVGAVGQIGAGSLVTDKKFVAGLVMIVLGVVGLVVSLIMMYSAEGQIRWKYDNSYPIVMIGLLVASFIVAVVGVVTLVKKPLKKPLSEGGVRKELENREERKELGSRKENITALIMLAVLIASLTLIATVAGSR